MPSLINLTSSSSGSSIMALSHRRVAIKHLFKSGMLSAVREGETRIFSLAPNGPLADQYMLSAYWEKLQPLPPLHQPVFAEVQGARRPVVGCHYCPAEQRPSRHPLYAHL